MDDNYLDQLNPLHMFLEKSCERIRNDLDLILATNKTLTNEYEKLYLDKKNLEIQYNQLLGLLWTCFAALNNNLANPVEIFHTVDNQNFENNSNFNSNAQSAEAPPNSTPSSISQKSKKKTTPRGRSQIKKSQSQNKNSKPESQQVCRQEHLECLINPMSQNYNQYKPILGSQPNFKQTSLWDYIKQNPDQNE